MIKEILENMDKWANWVLPLLTVLFIVSGALLGAYLTHDFRTRVKNNQSEIKRLTEEIKNLSVNIKNIQTGGDSYFLINWDPYSLEYRNKLLLTGGVHGNNSMKFVKVNITDHSLTKPKREKFDIFEFNGSREILYNNANSMSFNFGDILKKSGVGFITEIDLNEYKDGIDFSVVVNSENFRTQQNFIIYDIPNEIKIYNKIFIQEGERAGEVLYEYNRNFPINEKGIPIRHEKSN